MPVRAPLPAVLDPAGFEVPDGPVVTEVVVTWADTVFDVRHCDAAGTYTIGESPRASFPLHAPALPDCFPLLASRGGAPCLRFTADMRGELVDDAGTRTLAALIASGHAGPSGPAYTVPLTPATRATIHHGAVRFAVRIVPPARYVVDRGGFDRSWAPWVARSAAILLTLLTLAHLAEPPHGELRIDVMPEEPRYVGYLAGPPTHEIDRAHKTTPPRPGVRVGGTEPIEMAQELGKPLSKFERGRMAIQRRTTDERFSQRFGLEGADADDLLAHTASSFGSLSSNHLFATHATRDHLAETWARKHGPGEAYGRAGQSAYDVDEATGGHGRSDGLDTTGERDSIRQPRHTGAWDEVGVLGPLTTPEVRRVVAWRAASLRRCGPLGDARVHFTIDGLGVVRDVTTTAATRREARAAECVAGLVRRMWFPRGLGSVRITYPIPPSSPHHLSPAMQVVPADAPHTAP